MLNIRQQQWKCFYHMTWASNRKLYSLICIFLSCLLSLFLFLQSKAVILQMCKWTVWCDLWIGVIYHSSYSHTSTGRGWLIFSLSSHKFTRGIEKCIVCEFRARSTSTICSSFHWCDWCIIRKQNVNIMEWNQLIVSILDQINSKHSTFSMYLSYKFKQQVIICHWH